MRRMTLIAAVGPNWEIGKGGSLPWSHNSSDMRFFRDTTKGQVVVMGSRTFLSCLAGNPLPGRVNVVLTRDILQKKFDPHKIQGHGWIIGGMGNAIRRATKDHPTKEIFLIGGGKMFTAALQLGLVDRAIISHIPEAVEGCDTYLNQELLRYRGLSCVEMSTDPRYPGIVVSVYAKRGGTST